MWIDLMFLGAVDVLFLILVFFFFLLGDLLQGVLLTYPTFASKTFPFLLLVHWASDFSLGKFFSSSIYLSLTIIKQINLYIFYHLSLLSLSELAMEENCIFVPMSFLVLYNFMKQE